MRKFQFMETLLQTTSQDTFPQDLFKYFSLIYQIYLSLWDVSCNSFIWLACFVSVFNFLAIAEYKSQIFCLGSSVSYITQTCSQSCSAVTRSLSHSYCLDCCSSNCPASTQCWYWEVPDIIPLIQRATAGEVHIQGGQCCGGWLVYLSLWLILSSDTK